MQFFTQCYNENSSLYDKLELSSSSCPQVDMTPAGVYQPFDNPYLEAAFQALQGNDWVLEEEPPSKPDALPSIDLGQAEPPAQPTPNNRSDSYAMDGQHRDHPFEGPAAHPGTPAAPQDLNMSVLDHANTPPIRYQDQSGYHTNWEMQVSQQTLQPPHIGSERSSPNCSVTDVMQPHQELGNSPISSNSFQLHTQSQFPCYTPLPPVPMLVPYPAQPAYDTRCTNVPYTTALLSNASPPDNDIQLPSTDHPAPPNPSTPPPPAVTASPQPNPPPPPPRKKRVKPAPLTRRSIELTMKHFPEPDLFCQLCISRGKKVRYSRPERRMEHLAGTHIIQAIKGIKSYKAFCLRKGPKRNRPSLINSEERFVYARELMDKLHCRCCDKDTSAVLREDKIRRHMLNNCASGEGEEEKEKEIARLMVNQVGWHSMSDKILSNLPPEG